MDILQYWTDCMKNEELLHRGEEDGNVLHTIKRKGVNCNRPVPVAPRSKA